jgi:hypothetical protein
MHSHFCLSILNGYAILWFNIKPLKIYVSPSQKYVSLYIHGSEAYEHEDYKSVVNYIEGSLQDYLRGEEECRAYCEGPFDQGWFPDFVSSIASKSVLYK